MHVENRAPFLRAHTEKEIVSHDTDIVHDTAYSAEVSQCTIDDAVGGGPISDAVSVGGSVAPGAVISATTTWALRSSLPVLPVFSHANSVCWSRTCASLWCHL